MIDDMMIRNLSPGLVKAPLFVDNLTKERPTGHADVPRIKGSDSASGGRAIRKID
jgi:hypothetical protein